MHDESLHLDFYSFNPFDPSPGKFRGRYTLGGKKIDGEGPDQLGPNVLSGWASYTYVSHSHTMADCPNSVDDSDN
jgi:hypothetical protein